MVLGDLQTEDFRWWILPFCCEKRECILGCKESCVLEGFPTVGNYWPGSLQDLSVDSIAALAGLEIECLVTI